MNESFLDTGVKLKSQRLHQTRIAVGSCGSIGAVELVKLFRELRRHGAEVFPFVTDSVRRFITDMSLSWGAGRPPVRELEAEVEHLEIYDLVLIAPVTWNTLAKCSLGLADNPVTLLVASQLGNQVPVLFVPTMNLRLRNHPLYSQTVGRLREFGATIYESEVEEGRLKMPDPKLLVDRVVELVGKK